MKELDKYLHNWFLNNVDLDIEFKEGPEFENEEDTVTYSFTEKTPYDDLFRNICIDAVPEVDQFDDFILGLFHEVGHIITLDDFDEQEWNSYIDLCNRLEQKKTTTENDYTNYYSHPVEYLATLEGMGLIADNIDKVEELNKKIKELK